ncbi:hypothetical protein K402DRAFT_401428 [Aulographum hederae CBS 113979]|uniref:Uncharacterized protein n=1 Tax=Aulographum hederae CBS 113979 TaxID=1176131 RepID=A0A6G1H9M5_9PEZI|nr:hypothetical protein K402DRAFT_401428 [Aulographum hederae CBS 113979]
MDSTKPSIRKVPHHRDNSSSQEPHLPDRRFTSRNTIRNTYYNTPRDRDRSRLNLPVRTRTEHPPQLSLPKDKDDPDVFDFYGESDDNNVNGNGGDGNRMFKEDYSPPHQHGVGGSRIWSEIERLRRDVREVTDIREGLFPEIRYLRRERDRLVEENLGLRRRLGEVGAALEQGALRTVIKAKMLKLKGLGRGGDEMEMGELGEEGSRGGVERISSGRFLEARMMR